MNGTMWRTLTGFVMWLGKNGYAHIDQTERGTFRSQQFILTFHSCFLAELIFCYIILLFTYSCNTGWYVQYIDRSPEALRREKDREKRQKDELDDEEAYNEAINAARERDIAVLGIYSTFRVIT